MAQAIVLDGLQGYVSNIKESDYAITRLQTIGYGTAFLSEVLPFRVSFSTITIPGYGSNNPAPIGIAVIGLNNYIL